MRKKIMQNSKKGFSLPLAIGISAFLIIISASLLFIAVNSTSTTSAHINSRQAYLNVRSAIEYAQLYYNTNVTDYQSIGTEYMVMNDDTNGTTTEGASIVKNESDAQKAVTYVMAEYIAGVGQSKATFKLTAYSRYSDSFGNRAAVARLSVSFTIGANLPRLTVATLPVVRSNNVPQDRINLNIKKPANMDDIDLTYYVWTYKDSAGAYSSKGYNWNKDSGLTFDDKYKYDSTFIHNLNSSTKSSNEVLPNAEWCTRDDSERHLQKGPNGIVSDDGNNWFLGTYTIDKNRVPWFNIIFAQRGSILGKEGTNIYNSQTNEIFHLWYLDPSDKNIYFEFTGKVHTEGDRKYFTKYYKGQGWNGKDGLEDTIVVYVNNPKTLIHFAMKGIDKNRTKTGFTNKNDFPTIMSVKSPEGQSVINTSEKSYITNSGNKKDGTEIVNGKQQGIVMTYEGCGWWVANIETTKAFSLVINANGRTGIEASNITTDQTLAKGNREFWLVFDPNKGDNGEVEICEDEISACDKLGINYRSYVTVHAKVAYYNRDDAEPKLTYNNVQLNSSTGRQELMEILRRYRGISNDPDDPAKPDTKPYTDASFAAYEAEIAKGDEMINDKDFIKTRTGSNDDQRIKQADTEYRAQIKKIIESVDGEIDSNGNPVLDENGKRKGGLVLRTASEFGALNNAIDKAETIKANEDNRYDYAEHFGAELKGGNTRYTYIEAFKPHYDEMDYGSMPIYDYTYYADFIDLYNTTVDNYKKGGLKQQEVNDMAKALNDMCDHIVVGKYYDIDLGWQIGGLIDRGTLERKLASFEQYRDDKKHYEEDAHNTFVEAYNTALAALYRPDTTQTELDQALTDIKEARVELGKHPKADVELSTADFYKYYNQAATLLEKTEGYTNDSKDQLVSEYEAVGKAIETAADQTAVNKLTDRIKAAVDAFDYPVPIECMKKIEKEGKFRVWVYADKAPDNYTYDLIFYSATGSQTIMYSPDKLQKWGVQDYQGLENKLGYRYMYLDPKKYDKVSVAAYTPKVDGVSTTIESEIININDITDGNLVFVLEEDKITIGKMVTVYAMVHDELEVTVQYDGKKLPRANHKDNYYVGRFVVDADNTKNAAVFNKVFSLACVRNSAANKIETTYESKLKITEPGDYILKVIKTKTPVEIVTLTPDDIVPFAEPKTNNDDGPEVGGTLATDELEYSDLVNYYDDPELMNVDYYCDNDYVYFTDTQNWCKNDKFWNTNHHNTPDTIKAYFWSSSGKKGYDYPGQEMEYAYTNKVGDNTHQLVWRIRIPSGATNVLFNYRGDENKTVDASLQNGKTCAFWISGGRNNENKFPLGSSTINVGHSTTGKYNEQSDYIYIINSLDKTGDAWDSSESNDPWENIHVSFKGTSGLAADPGYIPEYAGYNVTKNGQVLPVYKIKPPVGANSFLVFTCFHDYTKYPKYHSTEANISLGKRYELIADNYVNSNNAVKLVLEGESYNDNNDNNNDNDNNIDIIDQSNYGQDGYEEDNLTNTVEMQKDIKLAYVGGNRVRIKNKTYYASDTPTKENTYSDGNKVNITDGNKFGGKGMNGDSGGRIGKTQLTAYTDWYEVKLPIPDRTQFTFALSGMDPDNKSIQTKTIPDASGNVWLEQLDNYRGNHNSDRFHYRNINLYTFDPEDKKAGTLPNSFTVYFKVPSGWGTPSITYRGPFGSTTSEMSLSLKRKGHTNIHYIENISKNTPFISFSINDKNGIPKTYDANLIGADKMLYDPLANEKTGGWKEFHSDLDLLHDEIIRLRSMYYGYAIFDNQNNVGDLYSTSTERMYSQGLVSYVTEWSRYVAAGGYYVMDADKLNDTYALKATDTDQQRKEKEQAAWDKYVALKAVLDNYQALYDKIYWVRAYIEKPLVYNDIKSAYNTWKNNNSEFYYPNNDPDQSGKILPHNSVNVQTSRYYEYNSRTYKSKQYSSESITYLKKKLALAEVVFLSNESTSTDVKNALIELEKAEASLVTTSEGTVCCILYDALAKKDKNYSWKIAFKLTANAPDSEIKTVEITNFNPEKFPIVYLSHDTVSSIPANFTSLYDVHFIETDPSKLNKYVNDKGEVVKADTPGAQLYKPVELPSKAEMKKDSIWVFMDSLKPTVRSWTVNSVFDYREINSPLFVQGNNPNNADEYHQTYTMKKDSNNKFIAMTLLFNKDATIERKNGANYVIKAGAYYFDEDSTKEPNTPIPDGTIDLFSDNAKTYFENASNYGMFVAGDKDKNGKLISETEIFDGTSSSIKWHYYDSQASKYKFKIAAVSKRGYVNLDVSEGNFATQDKYNYTSSKGIYFRWSSTSNLEVYKTVSLHSDDIRIASGGGVIDGSENRDSHFYLCSGTGKSTVKVTFLSDVYLKYKDKDGKIQEFAIREGTYILTKKANSNSYETINYVADLFDIEYWRKLEGITYISRSSKNIDVQDSSSGLHDGIYS